MSNVPNIEREYVPAASTLLVNAFLTGLTGLLDKQCDNASFRVCMHRAMQDGKQYYFQQVSDYFGTIESAPNGAGRIFAQSTGLVGVAMTTKLVWLTNYYDDEEIFTKDLAQSISESGSNKAVNSVPKSYFAVPCVSKKSNSAVLILYGESNNFNFYDESLTSKIAAMLASFCTYLDNLAEKPFKVENFEIKSSGAPTNQLPGVYKVIQKSSENIPPPELKNIQTFNFEFI